MLLAGIGIVAGCKPTPPVNSQSNPSAATTEANTSTTNPEGRKPETGSPDGSNTERTTSTEGTSLTPDSPLAKSDLESKSEGSLANAKAVATPSYQELQQAVEEEKLGWVRWMWCWDHGPLLMDVTNSLDGASPAKQGEYLTGRLLEELFPEGTEKRWEAIWDIPIVQSRFLGNPVPTDNLQKEQLTQRYDLNKDQIVNPREAWMLFSRGQSERGLVIEENNRFRYENRRSRLFAALDRNGNGRLDETETKQAFTSLLNMDTNSDYVLELNEIRPMNAAMTERMSSKFMEAEPIQISLPMPPASRSKGLINQDGEGKQNRLKPVKEGMSESQANRALYERYAGGLGIDPAGWRTGSDWLATLDGNQDAMLSQNELRSIWNQASSFGLTLHWTTGNHEVGVDDPLRLWTRSSTINLSKTGHGHLVSGSGFRLQVRQVDLLHSAQTERRLVSLAETLGVSSSKSAAIVEGLGGPSIRFSAKGLDRNQDGQLNWEELKWGVERKTELSTPIVRVRVQDVEDGWFSWLDTNSDQRLSESELTQANERLQELNTARDSEIAPESLPVQLDVLIVKAFAEEDPFREGQLQPNVLVAPNEIVDKPTTSAPSWFTAMDINRDGLVTPREFIGTEADLRSIDRDANGWLDLNDFEE